MVLGYVLRFVTISLLMRIVILLVALLLPALLPARGHSASYRGYSSRTQQGYAGCARDRTRSLSQSSAPTPRNMQWQTKSAAKAKDPLGIAALAHRPSLTVSFFGIPTGRNR